METWFPIPSHPDYDISDQGRVRSRKRGGLRVLRGTTHTHGYPMHRLDGTSLLVHRLVMEAFVGPRPPGAIIRHLDGDMQNNRLSNLTYGTQKQNMDDMVAHGGARNQHTGQTECKDGHPLEGENLYTFVNPRTGGVNRQCRTCRNDYFRRRRAVKAEERRVAATMSQE